MGITYYLCQRCANCCRWPGFVNISGSEAGEMAAYLGIPEEEFIARCTRLRADRRGLALRERADGTCLFLEGRDCRVQPVKPRQCRGFPNKWNFPGFAKLCEAIPVELESGKESLPAPAISGGSSDPGESGKR